MRSLPFVSAPVGLALALVLWQPGCQEYAGLGDTGVVPGEEPAEEEPGPDEEPHPGCDGGDCGPDDWPDSGPDAGLDAGPDAGPDGGPDGAPDAGPDGVPDGGDGECLSPFPQRLSLNLCGGLWACERDERGSARVVFERHRPEALVHEAWILWDGSREPIALQAGLPQGQDLPLVLGDWLQGSASARTPWWSDLAIELAAPSGLVVYRQEDRAFEVADPQGRCPPHLDPAGCGRRVYPILADGREQGLARVLEQGGALRHQWVGQLWQFLEMNCDDVPMGWIQSAEVSYARRSACRCAGPADCARDEICEPYAGKCVRNPCVVMDCTPGHVCDPFRGECVPRADPGCGADADCGPDEICHPVTRACVYDFCRFVDCAPCSPLLGGCYGCLHDCDCWPGVCDREARGCVDGCFLDKLDQQLRPENPSAYDYYRVCLEDALEDPAAVLRLFEPAVGCGVQPTPNTCPASAPVACIVPLERYPNQPTITWEAWQRLCHLSRNPLVHRLVGGHYLP